MKTVLSILLILILNFDCFPQGKLYVQNEPYLDTLILKNKVKNNLNRNMDGYRIQLFSGADRNNAIALKTRFLKEFPDISVYMLYQQPFFKIRVGDFRNKLEAQNLYYKLSEVFGQIIIVPDKINYPKL